MHAKVCMQTYIYSFCGGRLCDCLHVGLHMFLVSIRACIYPFLIARCCMHALQDLARTYACYVPHEWMDLCMEDIKVQTNTPYMDPTCRLMRM